MPNHVHGIIAIVGNGSKPFREITPPFRENSPLFRETTPPFRGNSPQFHDGIPEIIRQFKTFSSRYINDFLRRNGLEPFPTLWKKSYHDRIIRNEDEYLKIWRYINENPARWQADCFFEK